MFLRDASLTVLGRKDDVRWCPSIKTFFNQVDALSFSNLPYPYVHSEQALIKLFLYALVRGIDGFKTLHQHLQERPDVLELVGLDVPPHRTTLSRRYKTLSESLHELLEKLGERFIETKQADPSVVSLDSSLIHANGNLWHSKNLKAVLLPSWPRVRQV